MNTVFVSLYGGLGNQLFQYSAARALAHRHCAELVCNLDWFRDDNNFIENTRWGYALAPFELPVVTQFNLSAIPPFFEEKDFTYQADFVNVQVPVWLNGYFQSYKYFEIYAELLREEIGTARRMDSSNQSLLEHIKNSNSVGLHVRRGDYLSNKNAAKVHGICSLEYYKMAIAHLVNQIGELGEVFVFTDDPGWVKSSFDIGMSYILIHHNPTDSAHFDLWLMGACKHFITANSSLSWWGAWLGDKAQRVTIAPKQWFIAPSINTQDLIPPHWICL
jgi:Glycosyl transferase family 11